jgi:uroporphyrin-III C-methyltransferase/precorrin-2 dehydrogenase/sirohydrochlorin ferrochelatase
VYLVGAGPGNPELLTLKALHVLGEADVILHDRLVSEDILELARRDAKRIDVGKRAGRHHRSQREIHSIMLAEANKGRTVVRLKGGDAFVFGRGGEELEFLRRHGVDYEVVPGITAAIACAAFAGVPLTHREHAQALTFVTGHLSASGDAASGGGKNPVDWSGLAGPGRTVVVYMGLRQAGRIRGELLQAGIAGSTPAMVIADGSRDSQQVIEGCVERLAAMAQQVKRGAPALLIIGQVAALGSNLAWFHNHQTFRTAA